MGGERRVSERVSTRVSEMGGEGRVREREY